MTASGAIREKGVRAALVFGLLAAFGGVVSCSGAAAAGEETHIVVFHSNDVHGKIDAFAKIAALINRERESGSDVFYLSAGDNFTGNPVVDRADPPGEPMLALFNRVGLSAMSLGNHEFDYGLDALSGFILRARFPVVSANVQPGPGLLPELRPATVLATRDGHKIAVLGLLQVERTSGLPATHPDRIKSLKFVDPLRKASQMKGLRKGSDVFIALTHLGYDQDRLLAERVPDLDVIIGGHSHTRVDPAEIVNGVLIAQTGSDNRYLGRVDLVIRDGRLVEKRGRLIDLSAEKEEDGEVKDMIAAFNQNPVLARVLAEAPFVIEGKDALGCLMTDAWRSVLGLDIAFQNNGGIRANRLGEKITLKDAYAIDPFNNQIVVVAMTAAEIRGLIRDAFERADEIDLQVSGMSYTVRADRNLRVRQILLRGLDDQPLPENRTYRVGLSSYILSSYEFRHKDPGRALGTTTDALIRFLEDRPDLSMYRDIRRAILVRGVPEEIPGR